MIKFPQIFAFSDPYHPDMPDMPLYCETVHIITPVKKMMNSVYSCALSFMSCSAYPLFG